MNATDINTTRAARRLASVAIVSVLALSLAAAFATLDTNSDVINSGIFAWLGDYILEVGEALGAG